MGGSKDRVIGYQLLPQKKKTQLGKIHLLPVKMKMSFLMQVVRKKKTNIKPIPFLHPFPDLTPLPTPLPAPSSTGSLGMGLMVTMQRFSSPAPPS